MPPFDLNKEIEARAAEMRESARMEEQQRQSAENEEQERMSLAQASADFLKPSGMSIESAPFLDNDSRELLLGLIGYVDGSPNKPRTNIHVSREMFQNHLFLGKIAESVIPDKSTQMWCVNVGYEKYIVNENDGDIERTRRFTVFADGTMRYLNDTYGWYEKRSGTLSTGVWWSPPKIDIEVLKEAVVDIVAGLEVQRGG